MAGIWLRRIELVTTTSEIVGYKAGLAISRDELGCHVPRNMDEAWNGPDEEIVRIRSEEFEELVAASLYGVGYLSTPGISFPGIHLFHMYKNDPHKSAVREAVMALFLPFLEHALDDAVSSGKKSLDPTPFLQAAMQHQGALGVEMATELLREMDLYQQRSPWGQYRRVEWQDIAELKDLFKSESIETLYGSFIDQRFIDYIAANFHEIDRINWRKFEGLTCEFFERAGYHVEIGEGRDDGNIDARVWPKVEEREGPPAILVQCKRQKAKVGKVVVKALWADVVEEGASSGLVVTTSALSPGAAKVCTGRGYPIGQADRTSLRGWVEAMRTPSNGVFLGE